MTFELLLAENIKARYITCMPQDKDDPDCHVVNEVWLPELNKWAMIDSDMGGHYVSGLDGTPLSLKEMREHYIAGKKMRMHPAFGQGSSKVDDYYAYMAKTPTGSPAGERYRIIKKTIRWKMLSVIVTSIWFPPVLNRSI